MRRWGAVLAVAVAAASLLAAQGAAAKPLVLPAAQWSELSLTGSNAYSIFISANSRRSANRRNVLVVAFSRDASVEYQAHGFASSSGSVRAALPGVGRLAVRFNSLKTKREPREKGCRGRPAIVHTGVFRGVIRLHGEGGYTTVDAQHAAGTVLTSPRQVCSVDENEGKGSPHLVSKELFAGGDGVGFWASRWGFGTDPENTDFQASVTHRRRGMRIIYSAHASGHGSGITVPDSASSLEHASVEPPAPFTGSAAFTLTSPTTAAWEGDLGVVLPVVGPVPLTGPGWWSALCSGESCTHTAPPGGLKGDLVFAGSYQTIR